MNSGYIPVHLDITPSNARNGGSNRSGHNNHVVNKRRSNSHSQVVPTPLSQQRLKENPVNRNKVIYFVTLVSLNDTFIKKHLLIPYFPDTRKLGRPVGSKVKPDVTNGFFDSRVLSRSHAAMFIDPNTGSLMIKDLGSSNGTYINEERIGSDPVEIKIGDVIYLGFNIQADTNHKQISAKIENISIIPTSFSSASSLSRSSVRQDVDSPEFRHYTFVQDLLSKINDTEKPVNKKREMSYENALFGDLNPQIEDTLLGIENSETTGLFNNSQIASTAGMNELIQHLITCLTAVKEQNNALQSIDEFLQNYKSKMDEANSNYLSTKFEAKEKKYEAQLAEERANIKKYKDKYVNCKAECTEMVESLESKIAGLSLEKNELLQQLRNIQNSLNSSARDVKSDVVNDTQQSTAISTGSNGGKNAEYLDDIFQMHKKSNRKETSDPLNVRIDRSISETSSSITKELPKQLTQSLVDDDNARKDNSGSSNRGGNVSNGKDHDTMTSNDESSNSNEKQGSLSESLPNDTENKSDKSLNLLKKTSNSPTEDKSSILSRKTTGACLGISVILFGIILRRLSSD